MGVLVSTNVIAKRDRRYARRGGNAGDWLMGGAGAATAVGAARMRHNAVLTARREVGRANQAVREKGYLHSKHKPFQWTQIKDIPNKSLRNRTAGKWALGSALGGAGLAAASQGAYNIARRKRNSRQSLESTVRTVAGGFEPKTLQTVRSSRSPGRDLAIGAAGGGVGNLAGSLAARKIPLKYGLPTPGRAALGTVGTITGMVGARAVNERFKKDLVTPKTPLTSQQADSSLFRRRQLVRGAGGVPVIGDYMAGAAAARMAPKGHRTQAAVTTTGGMQGASYLGAAAGGALAHHGLSRNARTKAALERTTEVQNRAKRAVSSRARRALLQAGVKVREKPVQTTSVGRFRQVARTVNRGLGLHTPAGKAGALLGGMAMTQSVGLAPYKRYQRKVEKPILTGVTKREGSDYRGAAVGSGSVLTGLGLLGGGIPLMKPRSEDLDVLLRPRHPSDTRMHAAARRVRSGGSALRGGIFGYRDDAHTKFLRRTTASQARMRDAPGKLNVFARARTAGKTPQEVRIIRHLRTGRALSHGALGAGVGLLGYGLSKADRKRSGSEMLTGAGGTAAGSGYGLARLLEHQGRRWNADAVRNYQAAQRLVPGLGGYHVRRASERVPHVRPVSPDSVTRANAQRIFHGVGESRIREAGKLHGAAQQQGYFGHVYGSYARGFRRFVVPAGLMLTGVGATGMALERRKPRGGRVTKRYVTASDRLKAREKRLHANLLTAAGTGTLASAGMLLGPKALKPLARIPASRTGPMARHARRLGVAAGKAQPKLTSAAYQTGTVSGGVGAGSSLYFGRISRREAKELETGKKIGKSLVPTSSGWKYVKAFELSPQERRLLRDSLRGGRKSTRPDVAGGRRLAYTDSTVTSPAYRTKGMTREKYHQWYGQRRAKGQIEAAQRLNEAIRRAQTAAGRVRPRSGAGVQPATQAATRTATAEPVVASRSKPRWGTVALTAGGSGITGFGLGYGARQMREDFARPIAKYADPRLRSLSDTSYPGTPRVHMGSAPPRHYMDVQGIGVDRSGRLSIGAKPWNPSNKQAKQRLERAGEHGATRQEKLRERAKYAWGIPVGVGAGAGAVQYASGGSRKIRGVTVGPGWARGSPARLGLTALTGVMAGGLAHSMGRERAQTASRRAQRAGYWGRHQMIEALKNDKQGSAVGKRLVRLNAMPSNVTTASSVHGQYDSRRKRRGHQVAKGLLVPKPKKLSTAPRAPAGGAPKTSAPKALKPPSLKPPPRQQPVAPLKPMAKPSAPLLAKPKAPTPYAMPSGSSRSRKV